MMDQEDVDYCKNIGTKDRSAVCESYPEKFVNAYAVTRQFGGPEEGGWWYNEGTPLACIPVFSSEEEIETVHMLRDRLNPVNQGDIKSVLGGVKVQIVVERKWPRKFPRRMPVYQ